MKSYTVDTLPITYADIFISVGHNCRPAHWLQECGLRKCALPLDWMRDYPLAAVIDMLKNTKISYFSNFSETFVDVGPTRHVLCKKSRIEAIHHFPRNQSVKEYLPIFTKKFEARMDRLRYLVKKAKKVCFVMNRADNISEIFTFMFELSKLYPKKSFVLINIRLGKGNITTKYELNKNVILYEWVCNDINENGTDEAKNPKCWIGNTKIWKELMSKLRFVPLIKKRSVVDKHNEHKYF